VFTCVAALLSKKANAPVMMRVTRDDEYYIGRARPAFSRVKVGFRKDGRITALDGFVIVDNGPYDVVNDSRSAGDHVSLSYQPLAMRWRMVTVLTNTPPRGAQRAPGGFQANALMEPILAKASRKLGIDQVAIHRINAPEGKAPFGALTARGAQGFTTSANLKDALDKGAELFRWDERRRVVRRRMGRSCAASASASVRIPPARSGSTDFSSSSLTAASRSNPGSAISGPDRCLTSTASLPKCWISRGTRSISPGGTPRNTCRTRVDKVGVRRRTR
jgi:CO/xanthine dehydrogenase Mo-binding subunit